MNHRPRRLLLMQGVPLKVLVYSWDDPNPENFQPYLCIILWRLSHAVMSDSTVGIIFSSQQIMFQKSSTLHHGEDEDKKHRMAKKWLKTRLPQPHLQKPCLKIGFKMCQLFHSSFDVAGCRK